MTDDCMIATFFFLEFSQVKATDAGIPPRSARTELFIQVLDENDNNPYFILEPSSIAISEDTPIGEEVATLEARDADSGEFGKITYLLDRVSSQVSIKGVIEARIYKNWNLFSSLGQIYFGAKYRNITSCRRVR